MNTLAVDIGNTRIKAAVFSGVTLLKSATLKPAELTGWIKKYDISHAAIASVVRDSSVVLDRLSALKRVLLVNGSTPLPIKNRYATPKTLGADRIASAVGATILFPRKNLLVVDAGTCIKYDLVDRSGAYRGGAISPGLEMRFKALHTFTGKLPLLKPESSPGILGTDTRSSMLSGVMNAALMEAEGFIRAYRKQFPGLKVVATGGDAARLLDPSKMSIFAAPDLVLIGLNAILLYDLSKK